MSARFWSCEGKKCVAGKNNSQKNQPAAKFDVRWNVIDVKETMGDGAPCRKSRLTARESWTLRGRVWVDWELRWARSKNKIGGIEAVNAKRTKGQQEKVKTKRLRGKWSVWVALATGGSQGEASLSLRLGTTVWSPALHNLYDLPMSSVHCPCSCSAAGTFVFSAK